MVSQGYKAVPNPAAAAWLSTSIPDRTRISVVTLYELRTGAELLPPGKRRIAIERWIETEIREAFAARTIEITAQIADEAGVLTAFAKRQGVSPELADVLIAATALVLGLHVVTLNRKHFDLFSVPLVAL